MSKITTATTPTTTTPDELTESSLDKATGCSPAPKPEPKPLPTGTIDYLTTTLTNTLISSY
jgi:hypothetical protein